MKADNKNCSVCYAVISKSAWECPHCGQNFWPFSRIIAKISDWVILALAVATGLYFMRGGK